MLKWFRRSPRVHPDEIAAIGAHYPEIRTAGSLREAVRRQFSLNGHAVRREPYRSLLGKRNGWPAYILDQRTVSITLALHKPLFIAVFNECDEPALMFEATSLAMLATAMNDWLVAKCDAAHIAARYSDVQLKLPSQPLHPRLC